MSALRFGHRCVLCVAVFGASLLTARAAAAPVQPPARIGAKDAPRNAVAVKEVERRFTASAAAPGLGPKGAGPSAHAAPGVTLEQFLLTRHQKVKAITESQIAKIRSLIRVSSEDDPQRPDFLFRLGELHAENQRFYFNQARALDQKIFEAPPADKARLRTEQQRLEQREQTALLESVKAYAAASRHGKYERMDEVLFRLAYLLASVRKHEQARELLLRLIKDHPTSKYIPDAYLVFADLNFEKGEMEAALRFYEKVEQFPGSAVYPYAVYKKGWCHINLGDFKAALTTFVAVARLAGQANGRITLRQLEVLAKEARKDIVTAYARVGGPDKAWEFFRRVGGDGAPRMMEGLAERYWEQGQAVESTSVYRRIIAENMDSPRVCEWQGKVLRNTLSAGDKAAQTQELERLGAVYDRARQQGPERAQRTATTTQANPGDRKDRLDECRTAFHDAARELALVWHREAQRTRSTPTYALAERAYRLFLGHFPTDQDAYEMSYYLGELLWVLERWKEAAEQYTAVVEANPRGKYVRDAAYAAVLAWQNVLAAEEEAEKARRERERPQERPGEPREKLTPQPIPAHQQKLIEAFRTYRAHVPDAPELPAIIYREAYVYYDHNHFDRAEPLFREVIERFPRHELAVVAANLFLDSLNAQRRTKELVGWVRKFLDTPALLKDTAFATQLISLLSDSYDAEARAYESRGDAKECGRSFLAAAEAVPAHAKHAERLWNAAQCFQNAHLVGQAIKTWEALIQAHPADPLAKRALFRVGAGYQQLAHYTRAADKFEEFAKRFPGEPQAVAALGNAITFREGLGQAAQAVADMESFVGYYADRRPADAAGVFFQKADVYEKQGRTEELRDHLRVYLERWGGRGGVDRQVRAHFRLGELAWKASCPSAMQDGACLQVERVTSTRGLQVLAAARRRLGKQEQTQCGPPTKSKITVGERNRQQAAAAEEHLRAAVRLWKAGEGGNPVTGRAVDARRAAAAYAAAGAAFYLAEGAYEDLLRVAFPRKLDFSQPSPFDSPRRRAAAARRLEDSNRRFTAYLADKATRLERARTAYLEVLNLRQAHWTIAAAARIGQLHQDFAAQLYTAEIPKDLPEIDRWGNRPRDLYCDALEDRAGKVEAQAVEAFTSCLNAATKESWYSEWSRLCERELNQLEPARFPLTSEIKPEAGFVPTTMSAASVISALDEANPGS